MRVSPPRTPLMNRPHVLKPALSPALRPVPRGAVLRGAVLRGAVLRGAVLRGAVPRGAVLRGAILRTMGRASLRAGGGAPAAASGRALCAALALTVTSALPVAAPVVISLAIPQSLSAQARDETLADIRQELTILNVEIQKLRRELSTTGGAGEATVGGSALNRMDALESEVQRLTAKTEQLEFRINRIVADGSNRIGDLEFRLVELEGGDISKLGETSTLGGESAAATNGTPTTGSGLGAATGSGSGVAAGDTQIETDGAQLAVAEAADFKRAQAAFEAGDFASAGREYQNFLDNYPGSPMQARAELGRGRALEAQGETTLAARAYLAAFSAAPTGPVAADSLYALGRGLAQLGQGPEACTTLREVGKRFPGSPSANDAAAEVARLGCP